MDNAPGVRGSDCISDLDGVLQYEIHRQRLCRQSIRQSLALKEFHDEIIRPHIVQGANVRVIESGDRTRLALKTCSENSRTDLQCDGPVQPRIDGPEDFAHAALAERRYDAVRSELGARKQGGVRSGSQKLIGIAIENALTFRVLVEQYLHLASKVIVARAGCGKECAAAHDINAQPREAAAYQALIDHKQATLNVILSRIPDISSFAQLGELIVLSPRTPDHTWKVPPLSRPSSGRNKIMDRRV
jgi:hypothetical protein